MRVMAMAVLVASAALVAPAGAVDEKETADPRLAWFEEAKLGIFVHWGLYAVNGIPESWSFFNGQISHEDYLKQRPGFTAERYDPQEWAALFKRAGEKPLILLLGSRDAGWWIDNGEGDGCRGYYTTLPATL